MIKIKPNNPSCYTISLEMTILIKHLVASLHTDCQRGSMEMRNEGLLMILHSHSQN
jgi:hypothetical protein